MTPQKMTASFLNELKTGDTKPLFSLLNRIVENLENKVDPETIEIEMVDLAYQVIEKFQLLEAAMNKYVVDSHGKLEGSVLSDLYERQTNLFDN
jgi:hypothetical protein